MNLDGLVKKLTLINELSRRVYEAKLANVCQDVLQKLVTTVVTRAFSIEEKRLGNVEVLSFTQPM